MKKNTIATPSTVRCEAHVDKVISTIYLLEDVEIINSENFLRSFFLEISRHVCDVALKWTQPDFIDGKSALVPITRANIDQDLLRHMVLSYTHPKTHFP